MTTIQISRARQSQLAHAFRAGRAAMAANAGKYDFQVPNQYAVRDQMPEDITTVQGSMWHAFEAGKLRAIGKITDAATMLRNARFCMRRATERGIA